MVNAKCTNQKKKNKRKKKSRGRSKGTFAVVYFAVCANASVNKSYKRRTDEWLSNKPFSAIRQILSGVVGLVR
jgi:hypothetical protein